ncbi:hypothetical protein [Maliponia aquimaris]|uniref:hypothetical protein n=1 Tax=Maliponia aquimaris TaxID=1673631 RepID=UPI003F9D7912
MGPNRRTILGAYIRNSLVSSFVRTHSCCAPGESLVMPHVSAQCSTRITRAIINSGVRIPEGLVVGEDHEQDARWFRVTSGGVTRIMPAMVDRWTDAHQRRHHAPGPDGLDRFQSEGGCRRSPVAPSPLVGLRAQGETLMPDEKRRFTTDDRMRGIHRRTTAA